MCIAFNRMANTGANLHCSNFTQNLRADQLPLSLVYHFDCIKNYGMFDCIDPENVYKNNW